MLGYLCVRRLWVIGFYFVVAFFAFQRPVRAEATSPLQRARKTFQQFEFSKAAKLLQTLLKSQTLSSSQQAEAYLLLGMCQYNQAQFPAANQAFRNALKRNPTIQLPSGQSPAVVQQFEKLRAEEQQRRAQERSKAETQPRPPLTRRPTVPQPPPRKRPVTRTHRRPALKVRTPSQPRSAPKVTRRKASGSLTQRTTPPSFAKRHTLSLTLLIAGGVVMLAGAGVGVGYQMQNNSLQSLGQDPQSTGLDVSRAYQQAFATGVTSTVLLSAGGLFAGTGLTMLLYKSLKGDAAPPRSSISTTQGRIQTLIPNAE